MSAANVLAEVIDTETVDLLFVTSYSRAALICDNPGVFNIAHHHSVFVGNIVNANGDGLDRVYSLNLIALVNEHPSVFAVEEMRNIYLGFVGCPSNTEVAQ